MNQHLQLLIKIEKQQSFLKGMFVGLVITSTFALVTFILIFV
jgi:hypothetical protein